MNVICFRHPSYDGTTSPALTCKTCCGLFLAELKRQHTANGGQPVNTEAWLKDKTRQAHEAVTTVQPGHTPNPRSL